MENVQQVYPLRPNLVGAFSHRLRSAITDISPCFASCAVPYGGFEKASQLMKFVEPKIVAPKLEPEPPVVYPHGIGCRPSFNRTPIGWMGSSEPSSIHIETDAVPFDGETEEL